MSHFLNSKDIGSVTAYGDALTGGYDGSKETFYSFILNQGEFTLPINPSIKPGECSMYISDGQSSGEVIQIPTFDESIEWDGTQKTAQFTNYNPETMTVTGNTGTDAGDYTAIFTPKSGYVWTDGGRWSIKVSWSISQKIVAIPTLKSNLVYDGTEQDIIDSTYDTNYISVSGNTATNAGNYTVTMSLVDNANSKWSDDSTEDIVESWSIAKAVVIAPTVSSSLVYDGTEQTATVSTYDPNLVSVTGITGTNVGIYTATISIISKENAEWEDGTIDDIEEQWSISQAIGWVTVSENVVMISDTQSSVSVDVSAIGAITVSSSDESIATASVTGGKVVITIGSIGVTGNNIITVSLPQTTNYTSAETIVKVYANSYPVYGVYWDGGESPAFTRTDASVGIEEPVAAQNNGNGSSPFDDIYPWSGMQVVEDATVGSLVSIPKYYYKWTRNGASMKLQITQYYQDGFHVSPAHADRGDGQGERDVVYIARYSCGSDYKSKTGVAPIEKVSLSNARTNVHNLGSDIWALDHAMYWTILLLYLVEYATWDSQVAIGSGYGPTYNAVTANGYTDRMLYHTGCTSSRSSNYCGVQYRHIEGLWGNGCYFLDGCYSQSLKTYCIKNPADYAQRRNGVLVSSSVSANYGITASWTNSDVSGFEYAIMPKTFISLSAANAEKYITARGQNGINNANIYYQTLDFSPSSRSSYYGAFYVAWGLETSTPYYFVTRLMKLPNNT